MIYRRSEQSTEQEGDNTGLASSKSTGEEGPSSLQHSSLDQQAGLNGRARGDRDEGDNTWEEGRVVGPALCRGHGLGGACRVRGGHRRLAVGR